MTKNSERVQRRRKKVKRMLVEALGGACWICGYNKYMGALEFHHLDPSTKEFGLSQGNITRSYDKMLAEAKKCALLCSNCHHEVEGGIVVCPIGV